MFPAQICDSFYPFRDFFYLREGITILFIADPLSSPIPGDSDVGFASLP
jgi:hypothetical protein